MITLTQENIAYITVRIFTGILFFAQGYDKIFKIKIAPLIETIRPAYLKAGMPSALITFFAIITSYSELLGGFLLLTGLLKPIALGILALDLLLAAAGLALLEPLLDLKHVFPRLILVVFLIMMHQQTDFLSLDYFLSR